MKHTEKMSVKNIIGLHARAMKNMRKACPGLFGATIAEAVIIAVIPYITIFFSARIIDELAGLRRSEILWKWVLITVLVEGSLALLKAAAYQYHSMKKELSRLQRKSLNMNKMFAMDFADVDKQETQDLYIRVMQAAQWGGWGMEMLDVLVRKFTQILVGVISAISLSVGLFTAKVPETAGYISILNHPVFIVIILGVMLMISFLAGGFGAKAQAYFAKTIGASMFGNKLFIFYAFLGESKQRAADIRMYDQQKVISAYSKYMLKHFRKGGEITRVFCGPGGLCNGMSAGISAVFTGFVYVFVCVKAWSGAFGVGAVTQYIGAITALSQNVSDFLVLLGEVRANAEHLKNTYDFLDIPNTMYQGSLTTEKRSDRQYEVEFKDVSFRYPGTEIWALRHVNAKFKVGNRLAVVGENGSGKTTFIKLLCRLYDPQEGQILLNGIDIRKYNYRDYRNVFSVVFQDFQLLSQSLGANVAGEKEYDCYRVVKALTDAGFGERLTQMPEGLDTLLYKEYDEDGVEVSGGEAQKIAIARALYKDAPFLILDEPTAALDPIAEAEIYAQLNQIVGDKTAIYISHRLSSCRFCDEIMVFENGQVVQQGSHDTLVQLESGKYYELWQAQAQYYVGA